MAVENRKPDWECDCERHTVRVYFGERSEEERMRAIKTAAAGFVQKIQPQLIRLGKLDQYSRPLGGNT